MEPQSTPLGLGFLVRYPLAGQCKTRLGRVIGMREAALIQRFMTEHVLLCALQSSGDDEVSVLAIVKGDHAFKRWIGWPKRIGMIPQYSSQNFGLVLHKSFEGMVSTDSTRSWAILGTDLPSLTVSTLDTAIIRWRELIRSTMDSLWVCAPSVDGGWWFGASSRDAYKTVLESGNADIRWSSEFALEDTMRNGGIVLSEDELNLRDIDELEDLEVAIAEQSRPAMKWLSIVIPCLNEGSRMISLIKEIRDLAEHPETIEVVIVDGGSCDGSFEHLVEVSKSNFFKGLANLTLVQEGRGRGDQMNIGAQHSNGVAFLFLHADCRLPTKFDSSIWEAFEDPAVAIGAFTFEFDCDERDVSCLMRVIRQGVAWRSKFTQLPYGDQGLFCTRFLFEILGGYPAEHPLLEDVALVTQARTVGKQQIHILPDKILVSARRWIEKGCIYVFMVNQVMLFGYKFGIAPSTLYRWYYSKDIKSD